MLSATDEYRFVAYLYLHGCRNIKVSNCGIWAATKKMAYVTLIISGQVGNYDFYDDSWYYNSEKAAVEALENWDLRGAPPGGSSE